LPPQAIGISRQSLVHFHYLHQGATAQGLLALIAE
jgi:hypothetical protein